MSADFNQKFSSGWGKTDGNFTIDYSVKMGDGINPTTAYDENGNILRMTQKGLLLNVSSNIDSLQYSYAANSNKLMSVTDLVSTNYKLGDFTDNNTTGDDYTYDSTGSLTTDKNKGHTIAYNQFNLPYKITIPGKGDITYIYDAAGRKLEKRTHILKDSTRSNVEITATTAYISGYIYQDNKLSFFGHEEGRIRVNTTNSGATAFVYDYLLKDHLGNIRTVLTDEQKSDAFPPASMEFAKSAAENALYSNVDDTRSPLPPGYPTDNYTNPNTQVARLDGNNKKIGPGITLKVMAGDRFNVKVSSWYRTNGATPQQPVNPLTDLLLALTNGISGAATTTHGTLTPANLQNSGVLSPNITSFLDSQQVNVNKPKAYLNWILLDEHFKLVSSSSGAEQVGDNDEFKQHIKTDLPIDKNGYLSVYISNETPNIPVFFDNLQVTHTRGPLLEEDHYYPFGLQMKALCSKAENSLANNFKFNSGTELDTDFDLSIYETPLRPYDPQTGRFTGIDILGEENFSLTPFHFANNNPILLNDPTGALSQGGSQVFDQLIGFLNQGGDINDIQVNGESVDILSFGDDCGASGVGGFVSAITGMGGIQTMYASGNETKYLYYQKSGGNYNFVHLDGSVYKAGSDRTGFVDKVLGALNTLGSINDKDGQISSRFDMVVNSKEFTHLILYTDGGSELGAELKEGCGQEILWNPNQNDKDGSITPYAVSLGHELLGHSFLTQANIYAGNWFGPGPSYLLNKGEADSHNIENLIRAEIGNINFRWERTFINPLDPGKPPLWNWIKRDVPNPFFLWKP